MKRLPGRDEKMIIQAFEALGMGVSARLMGDKILVMDEEEPAGVFLADPALLELPRALRSEATGGLRIGSLEQDGFRLDLQGAVLLARETAAQTVRLTASATQHFLYGRDIFGDSVERADPELSIGDACIVCDPRGQGIGLALVVGKFKGRTPALRPVHDLGTYLRDQDDRVQHRRRHPR